MNRETFKEGEFKELKLDQLFPLVNSIPDFEGIELQILAWNSNNFVFIMCS